jgi:hypothetical protein
VASTKFILSQYLLCVFAVIRDVFWGLRIMAAPVVLAICAMVALYVPDQTLEIYRVIVEDLVRTWEDPVTLGTTRTIAMIAASREASLSVVGLIGMAFAFWYVARLLGLKFAENLPAQSRVTRIAARWIPVVIALLPILAVAYGIRRAHTGAYIWTMWFSSLAMIGLAAVLFLAFSLIDQRANSNNPHAAKDHFLTWKLRCDHDRWRISVQCLGYCYISIPRVNTYFFNIHHLLDIDRGATRLLVATEPFPVPQRDHAARVGFRSL